MKISSYIRGIDDEERAWLDLAIGTLGTLIALVEDNGEEFLEHLNHRHGHSASVEPVTVPVFVTWPGVVPEALAIDRTTQSTDLMPYLPELDHIPVPTSARGVQSDRQSCKGRIGGRVCS